MSAPVGGPPPLPIGWTEHLGPGGQVYYFNSQTQVSTYARPLPALPLPTQPIKKKEKPLVKTPIPGTDWLRVRTTEGNVFYSHKVKKESIWTVPDEIKDLVDELEKKEREVQDRVWDSSGGTHAPGPMGAEQEEMEEEIQRVKADVQDLVKRKAEDASLLQEAVSVKKLKLEDNEEAQDSDDSEEEDWQREAAAQLAEEARAERKKREEDEARQKAAEEQERVQMAQLALQLNIPDRVDLSLEEAKALFKTLLREKNVNPLHPWDTSLPLFVSDPRYILLPSVSARREAFDEYCRDRAREIRQNAAKQAAVVLNPKAEFERLLEEEVQSTRTSWTDFRRTWKKDRRFYGWGRDDRERERKFRDFLKELGEKKRVAAQRAEAGFLAMLKENGSILDGSKWKDIKRNFTSDPRYDAVGSSSLREELFQAFIRGTAKLSTDLPKDAGDDQMDSVSQDLADTKDSGQAREEKKERAVKEREEKIRAERQRLDVDINRSRREINMDEGERDFKSLLVDAIRDPRIGWEAALPQLATDSRMRNSPLPLNQQLHLFHIHVAHLRSKHLNGLHALFETHAPTLAVVFDALPLSSLLASGPVAKLGYDMTGLEKEFEKWQRTRTSEARKAFDEMLTENSFVEFWGRLGKIGGEGVEGGVKAEEEGEDGEGGGGKVDMKVLAKNVDVGDMEKVLKNDRRYIMFDHVPEQREAWIRDYLGQLSAPKLSVHIPQTAA